MEEKRVILLHELVFLVHKACFVTWTGFSEQNCLTIPTESHWCTLRCSYSEDRWRNCGNIQLYLRLPSFPINKTSSTVASKAERFMVQQKASKACVSCVSIQQQLSTWCHFDRLQALFKESFSWSGLKYKGYIV